MEDQDELFFELKCEGYSIKITPIKFTIHDSEYSWDKNWIKTKIEIKAGVFTGTYLGEFMTYNFVAFKKDLQNLYINLDSSAKFEGLEGYLKIDIKGDGLGHLDAICIANDTPGYGNELTSYFYFDQTYIPQLLKQLDKICEYFPVTK